MKSCAENWGGAYEENMSKILSAVRSTDGQYLSYGGEAIEAVFHSSSAGKTEDSAELWSARPYLVSVDSPETAEDVPNYVTTVTVPCEDFAAKLSSLRPGADFSGEPALWLGPAAEDASGRVDSVEIGGAQFTGQELRELFSLRSTAFTLDYTVEGFLFTVTGFGHGVGMSQYGANVMAENGSGYREILAHYYPGTDARGGVKSAAVNPRRFGLFLVQFRLRLAVEAAVGVRVAVGEEEDLVEAGLHGGDAPGVAAFEDVHYALRQVQLALIHELAVAYDVYGRVRVDEAYDAEVYVAVGVYLDDVLAPELARWARS